MQLLEKITNPSLTPETRLYIERSYERMLLEKDGQVEPAFSDEDMTDVLCDEIINRRQYGVDVVLGVYLTWDVRQTLIDRPDEDIRSIGRAEVIRRDRLGEMLAKAPRYERVSRKLGIDALAEPDKPYSPKIVTLLVGHGTDLMLELKTRRQRRQFRWLIEVPPAFRDYAGNLR